MQPGSWIDGLASSVPTGDEVAARVTVGEPDTMVWLAISVKYEGMAGQAVRKNMEWALGAQQATQARFEPWEESPEGNLHFEADTVSGQNQFRCENAAERIIVAML